MQFVKLQSPDSLIQQLVISTDFSKRLYSQIGNLVGHDRLRIVISTTESIEYNLQIP